MTGLSGLSGLSGLTGVVKRQTRPAGAGASSTWSNPGNITASDDTRATVTVAQGGSSGGLFASAFGFAIPGGATVLGILVEVERSKAAGPGLIEPNEVSLQKGENPEGNSESDGIDWPTTDTVIGYGGPAHLFNGTWTPAEVNGDFRVRIDAGENGGGDVTLRVDHVRVTVWYE